MLKPVPPARPSSALIRLRDYATRLCHSEGGVESQRQRSGAAFRPSLEKPAFTNNTRPPCGQVCFCVCPRVPLSEHAHAPHHTCVHAASSSRQGGGVLQVTLTGEGQREGHREGPRGQHGNAALAKGAAQTHIRKRTQTHWPGISRPPAAIMLSLIRLPRVFTINQVPRVSSQILQILQFSTSECVSYTNPSSVLLHLA